MAETQKYQRRVMAEADQLQGRIAKLETFIASPAFDTELDQTERRDLLDQLKAMLTYADVLERRIAYFRWKE